MLCTERHVRKGPELAQVSFDPAALFGACEINCEKLFFWLARYMPNWSVHPSSCQWQIHGVGGGGGSNVAQQIGYDPIMFVFMHV